jgi:hypothetical protein
MTHDLEVTNPGTFAVIVHASPGVCPAQFVLVRKTTVPGGPVFGVRVTTPAAAWTGSGTVIEEMETNSAEVSSSTKNKELELRVANSKHTTINS